MSIRQDEHRAPQQPAGARPGLGQRIENVLRDVAASRGDLIGLSVRVAQLESRTGTWERWLAELPMALRDVDALQELTGSSAANSLGSRIAALGARVAPLESLPAKLTELDGRTDKRIDNAFHELHTLREMVVAIHQELHALGERVEACCTTVTVPRQSTKPGGKSGNQT